MARQLTEVQSCSDWRHVGFPVFIAQVGHIPAENAVLKLQGNIGKLQDTLRTIQYSPKGAPLVTLSSFLGRYSSPVVSLSASRTVSWVTRRFLAHFTSGPVYLRQMIQSHEGMFSIGYTSRCGYVMEVCNALDE